MGLFSGFRKIINKTISLSPYQRNDMVVFMSLKGGFLKVNSEIEVEEGFCAIVTHYDNICDVLSTGIHKFDSNGMPILSKFAKPIRTKTGYIEPKKIKADIYYINLKNFDNNYFRTGERIVAYEGKEKVKLKVDGTFNVKVINSLKLIKALLSDMAVIKEGKALKEVCALTGEAVSKVLNSTEFQIQDYIDKNPKITELLNQRVNKTMETYGVENSNIVINQLYLKQKEESKNDNTVKNKKGATEKQPSTQPEKIIDLNNIKGLSEAISNVGKKKVVYVKPVLIGADEFNEREEKRFEKRMAEDEKKVVVENNTPTQNPRDAFEKYSGQFTNTTQKEQPVPEIISTPKKQEIKSDDLNDNTLDNIIEQVKARKKTQKQQKVEGIVEKVEKVVVKETENKKPKKLCKYCNTALEHMAKFCYNCGKSTEEYVVCQCCGAKNFSDATECLLCHSKLG